MGHKTLCEWRRHEIPTDLKALRKIVRKPKFVCGKCARSANDKGYLCQPLRLDITKHLKPGPNTIRIEPFAPKAARLVVVAR